MSRELQDSQKNCCHCCWDNLQEWLEHKGHVSILFSKTKICVDLTVCLNRISVMVELFLVLCYWLGTSQNLRCALRELLLFPRVPALEKAACG